MKLASSVCIFCVITSSLVRGGTMSEETVESMRKIGRDCQKETNTNEADFDHTVVQDKIPNTRDQACLYLCVGTKLGFMHKNGTANVETALKFIEAENKNSTDRRDAMEKSKRVMRYCNENHKPMDDNCTSAKMFLLCYDRRAKLEGLM